MHSLNFKAICVAFIIGFYVLSLTAMEQKSSGNPVSLKVQAARIIIEKNLPTTNRQKQYVDWWPI